MFKGEENMVQSIGEFVAGRLKDKSKIGQAIKDLEAEKFKELLWKKI